MEILNENKRNVKTINNVLITLVLLIKYVS